MGDGAMSVRESTADEQRIGRILAIALPIVTVSGAAVVGLVVGPATSILVVAGGLLIGVISLLWGSIRILSGEAALAPELEALDQAAQGIDSMASRKKMLLRALKDLENEHAIGKIEEDDFAQISQTYRDELKVVLKRIDESLAPHRTKAEAAAKAYLEKAGLGALDPSDQATAEAPRDEASSRDDSPAKTAAPKRRTCSACGASNEVDAKFCKECATKLAAPEPAPSEETSASTSTEDSDDE